MSGALYGLGLARCLRGDYDEALDALNRARDALLRSLRTDKARRRRPSAEDALRALSSSSSPARDDIYTANDPPSSSSSSLLRAMDADAARERSRRAAARIELARIEDARGRVHLLTGDAASALRCHLDAYAGKVEASGGNDDDDDARRNHSSALSSRMRAAEARLALGRYDEAESELVEILAARKLALYQERGGAAAGDADDRAAGSKAARRERLEADVAEAERLLAEVRGEQRRAAGRRNRAGSRGRSLGYFGNDMMAAIKEEKDAGAAAGKGGSWDDWGLAVMRR
uniref:Uncharacterized protein n=1 Tax=Odontella aurita TaxID=265563 RepID=A0A7S4IPY0_9STRA